MSAAGLRTYRFKIMETKARYKSRVVWVNIATFLAMGLALSEVTVLIPPTVMPYVTGLNALLESGVAVQHRRQAGRPG